MIFLLQHCFLLAIDLVLAMTLSCLLYAFACISIAFLTCCIIIFSIGTVERNVDVKGRAVVVLVSNSSIGRMFTRNLDKAGFRVSAAHWPTPEKGTALEECSSKTEEAQLHMTEDEYQKTVKTFVESHLSLKGMYGMMKKPSILIWEEGAPDTCGLPEIKTSCEYKKAVKAPWRNYLLQPGRKPMEHYTVALSCHKEKMLWEGAQLGSEVTNSWQWRIVSGDFNCQTMRICG